MANILILAFNPAESMVLTWRDFFVANGDTVTVADDVGYNAADAAAYDLVIACRLEGISAVSRNTLADIFRMGIPMLSGSYGFYAVDSRNTNNWETQVGLCSAHLIYNSGNTDAFVTDNRYNFFTVNHEQISFHIGNEFTGAYDGIDDTGVVHCSHRSAASIITFENGSILSNNNEVTGRVALSGLMYAFQTLSPEHESSMINMRDWLLESNYATISGNVNVSGVPYANSRVRIIDAATGHTHATVIPDASGDFSHGVQGGGKEYILVCEDLASTDAKNALVFDRVVGT